MILVPWGRDQPGVAARAAALGVAEVVPRGEASAAIGGPSPASSATAGCGRKPGNTLRGYSAWTLPRSPPSSSRGCCEPTVDASHRRGSPVHLLPRRRRRTRRCPAPWVPVRLARVGAAAPRSLRSVQGRRVGCGRRRGVGRSARGLHDHRLGRRSQEDARRTHGREGARRRPVLGRSRCPGLLRSVPVAGQEPRPVGHVRGLEGLVACGCGREAARQMSLGERARSR